MILKWFVLRVISVFLLLDVIDGTKRYCLSTEKKTILFTPGPVTTSQEVKMAMTKDEAIIQTSALQTIDYIRKNILKIDQLSKDTYTVIPLQGGGTFAIEAALQTATPLNGKVLVLKNGFFGNKLELMCIESRIAHDVMDFPDGGAINVSRVEEKLKDSSSSYSTVIMVHHETSFGVMNPVLEIGQLITRYNPGAAFIIDAVSSFGCYSVPMDAAGISFMISTPNKCLEAFPGMGFIIVRKSFLSKSKENHRSLVLDLSNEYAVLEEEGHMRSTWPLQVFSALAKGIELYFKEGRQNRIKRYLNNNEILRQGMKKLKFQVFQQENSILSFVLTPYKWPTNEDFNMTFFFKRLESEGIVIYPTPITETKVFRVANIGYLDKDDCKRFLAAAKKLMKIMKVDDPYKK